MHLYLLLLVLLRGDVTSAITSEAASEERIERLERVMSQLTRQVMLQQLYTEETARSGGDSGIKQVRMARDGSKPYYTATHTSNAVASIHDHSDHERTCGMGEVVAVLNGLEFRTRHNDYKLKMPSRSSGDYHATQDIPFPDVPPAVLQRTSVDDQITELREWFKAWRDGDTSVRDYRKYFKPNLCYLEGAWTTDVTLDEPFDSDRHQLEADSWFELQEQIRFTSYTGDKNSNENFAYLPTSVMNITEDGMPTFAQWNYRILCHPVSGDLPFSHLKPVDNLAARIVGDDSFDQYVASRAARFSVNPTGKDEQFRWYRLDQLMNQIPGKDNYQGKLNDTGLGQIKLDVFNGQPLNAGFYHRWYKVAGRDAMGEKVASRGFADRNLWVAETTQPRVAPVSVANCKNRWQRRRGQCDTVVKRVSYAIPLEIVYLTPLHTWNPFKLPYRGEHSSTLGKTVKADGRNGGMTPEKAYNGTNSKAYYLTPSQFFSGGEVGRDKADTTRNSVGVLDKSGRVRAVKSSGVRIFLPEIAGVGMLRTRYPIMPMHDEGDPVWKELEALRDVVMDIGRYTKYLRSPPNLASRPITNNTTAPTPFTHTVLMTSPSLPDPVGLHAHTIDLNLEQFRRMRNNRRTLTFDTSEENGHSHSVKVRYDRNTNKFRIIKCDGKPRCFDGHSAVLSEGNKRSVVP
ncbi:uncharacterized protein [Littorina saxatilis]|uniref:Uncharacterized protein n=1 Tax=Littorina saxatilis TaxID=31220 RepID=A0AAN9AWP8_9CAEN